MIQLIYLGLTDPDTASPDILTPAELCVWDSGSPGKSGLGCLTIGAVEKRFNEPLLNTLHTDFGDFNLVFKATGIGNTGDLDVTADVEDYLKFNWKATGNINPSARLSFGLYKGNSKQIYFREVY